MPGSFESGSCGGGRSSAVGGEFETAASGGGSGAALARARSASQQRAPPRWLTAGRHSEAGGAGSPQGGIAETRARAREEGGEMGPRAL